MSVFLTNMKFADRVGITKQGVGNAIRASLIFKSKAGINPDHPINVIYVQNLEKKRKKIGKTKKAAIKHAKKKQGRDSESELGAHDPAEPQEYDLSDRKTLEETRLKAIQADKAALEYGERLGIMMDDKTLRRKFGLFYDHILNDLIYLPESIADVLVNAARSAADVPEATQEVTNLLKKSLADVIKKGKKVSRKLRPPKHGRRYVVKKASK